VRSALLSVGEQAEVPLVLRREGIDLLHAPASFTFPVLAPRLVVTVHDFVLRRYPEFLPSVAGRAYYRLMNHLGVRGAARIAAVSEFTRGELLAFWPEAAGKTRVVLNGVAASFRPVREARDLERVRDAYELPRSFVLYVGTRKKHKNLPRLLEAYARLPESLRRESPLVAIAGPDPRYPEVDAAVARHGLTEVVRWRARVDERDLPAVYSLARLLVQPSLQEGFGLPVLEAMACGTPCLVARAGALPEVGGDACLYADPLDVADLHRGLLRLTEDGGLRAELSRRGIERARQLPWSRAAAGLAALYREALDGGR
jgi:glycosyltransferase involved in cell wall biosynthesis